MIGFSDRVEEILRFAQNDGWAIWLDEILRFAQNDGGVAIGVEEILRFAQNDGVGDLTVWAKVLRFV